MAYKNPVRLEVQESASSYPQVAFSDDTSEVAQSLLATAASASTNFKVQDAERLARIQQQHKARAVQILQMEVKWTLRLTEGAVSKDVLKQAVGRHIYCCADSVYAEIYGFFFLINS